MTSPGILPGGSTVFNGGFSRPSNQPSRRSNVGVFGKHPGATPKYALNRGKRDAESRETMARLYIDLPEVARMRFLESLPQNVQNLAQVLTTTGYIDFLLTNANETLAEKAQIVDTLTDNYVAFYSGQEPPVFQYSGTVLNTYQDDQRVWLLRLYRNILRGSRLANRNLVARLRYDSFIVTGYMEMLSNQLEGNTGRTAGSFSFNMRVKSFQTFTPTLVHPSVVETPATLGVTFASDDAVNYDGTARAATATPEAPPTASRRPAASSLAEIDPREIQVTAFERIAEEAAGNEGNASADANNSLSNVRGRVAASLDDENTSQERRRVEPRARGINVPTSMNSLNLDATI